DLESSGIREATRSPGTFQKAGKPQKEGCAFAAWIRIPERRDFRAAILRKNEKRLGYDRHQSRAISLARRLIAEVLAHARYRSADAGGVLFDRAHCRRISAL